MNPAQNPDRVRHLYQMLFEMATGNLGFRIPSLGHDDKLEELGKLLNSIAQAMQQAVHEAGYIIPHYTYQGLVQITFVLDSEIRITSLSASVTAVLGYAPQRLVQVPFEQLLSSQSTAIWSALTQDLALDAQFHTTIQLFFITAKGNLVPSFCTISRLLFSDKIMVSSITTQLQDIERYGSSLPTKSGRLSEARLMQQLHDYILGHLEEQLPSIKELSKHFGTNEFRLKDSFRRFFNTSVYQFYSQERLKKAHLLIQQTTEPLKVIAFSCGYGDYVNFYKAFKKHFGYPPSDLMRPNPASDPE